MGRSMHRYSSGRNYNDSGCFIATATMGNYNHPAVIELRLFRDNYLKQRSWGRKFVKLYYGFSPRIASIIEKHYILKRLSYLLIVKPILLIIKTFNKNHAIKQKGDNF